MFNNLNLILACFFIGTLALADDFNAESRKLTGLVSKSSYSLKYDLWNLSLASNGKGWMKVVGESYDQYQLVIDGPKANGISVVCRAPTLILNFKKISENQTQVRIDLNSIFFGKTLRQLFAENKKAIAESPSQADNKDNVLEFEVSAFQSMTMFGIYARINTDPMDDEDFGRIRFSFSNNTIDLEVYDGDDDGGKAVVSIHGANGSLFDQAMPQLKFSCK